jgi:S-formylglutathione hydrolase FrmB
MVFAELSFTSATLGMGVSINVLLPAEPCPADGWPTLWLLHGLGDDHTTWTRRTSIERHAEGRGLAIVMPGVQRSFYTDQVHGRRYFSYVADELPARCRDWFRLSAAPRHNHVAGLSMGGYGAFKLALTHPDRYATAASLSGALHIDALGSRSDAEELRTEMRNTFGDLNKPRPSDDLLALARARKAGGVHLPALLQMCGTGDYLYPINLRFRNELREIGIDCLYEEGPGEHRWAYWDAAIQRVLDWVGMGR